MLNTDLDIAFAALADPIRRAIVVRLALEGEANVLDLAAPFDISLPAISRHLKVLEAASLIERGRRAQHRPCRIRTEALAGIAQWVDHTRAAWNARLDRLEAHVAEMQKSSESGPKSKPGRGRKKESQA